MKPNIELNIDELVLQGFSRNDAFYIGKAVEEELTRLIEAGELAAQFTQDTFLKRLEGKSFEFSASARPAKIGRQIARSIYSSISAN